MLINVIFQIYTYITNILCSTIRIPSNKMIEMDNSNIDTNDFNYDTDEFNEEYIDDVPNLDKQVYNKLYTYNKKYHITLPKNSLHKSQSYSTQNYYCGHCSNHIQSPQYMYVDKSYCSIYCRNNQIKSDNAADSQNRERHSFSV